MSVKGDKMKARTLNQFKVSTNLLAMLDAINNRFDDGDAILDYLLYNRFLDTAVGVWLNVIGRIVGLARPFVERDDVFTYKSIGDADDATLAYGNIAGSTGGVWTSLRGATTGDLVDDDTYRALLNAKIFATNAKPTIPNIYLFIKLAFDDAESIVTSPTPGQIEVELVTALSNAERRLLVELAPVGAGKQITIINWP